MGGLFSSLLLAVIFLLTWPHLYLMQFYFWLFRRELPSKLELGGLFIMLVMAGGTGLGFLIGLAAGFVLLPWLWPELGQLWQGLTVVAIYFVNSLIWFELGYRWGQWEAKR
ncbi:hypothetical protein RHP47_01925 [Thermosynechococcus sp. QKsg1]|uniref:hypothetical protein n=1 Tax=unclassified Thermosynechococcus TaxID=2622553 RepID=UPI001680270A|nr:MULTISPECIES: hypothetical protein [unclassified Thermosynechococcus]WJI24460.1 hypothetical protein MZ909_01925 [Thermosynechococcus sp. B0]WKT84091.1 hypothetical protein QYC28_01885 [Thermosynechococcus sp. HY596]WNC63225.1 hypothetical protein RHK13_01885 [Thermosynechococcus sp. HY591]WNC65784.1 hypothetical protein RHK28_01890 [Thermosynechococcus sp. HY593]WNC87099.1 hypothetical protein RHP47_01925 [Thermosynechococcus sp. QKsg1]